MEKYAKVAQKAAKLVARDLGLSDTDRDELVTEAYLKLIEMVQRYEGDDWWEAKLRQALTRWKSDSKTRRRWHRDREIPLTDDFDREDHRQIPDYLDPLTETGCPHEEMVRKVMEAGSVDAAFDNKNDKRQWYRVRTEVISHMETVYGYRYGERPSEAHRRQAGERGVPGEVGG